MTVLGTLTFRPSDRHWILRIGARYLDIAPPTEADGEDPLATLRALADSVRPVAAAWGFGDCSASRGAVGGPALRPTQAAQAALARF